MAQNAMHLSWKREEVDYRLQQIMHNIHATCCQYGRKDDGHVDYVDGANIGGFVRVARAMIAQGAL
jgi:glutamate dehydrogenase (NADP+)